MDQLQQYLQNILTEHLQNMHGSLCSIKFIWQQNNSRQRRRNHQVAEIRNITEPTLHACASHQRDHKNTWTTPQERKYGILQNTGRDHAHKMQRLNDTKITKLQVLPSNSRQQQLALLHQRFGHQDGLK